MRTQRMLPTLVLLALFAALPAAAAAQSVLVEAKTSAGAEVATIRTDSMRLLVPLHLLVGGVLFPDGTLQTTAAGGTTSVTSADIVDGSIVNADISATAAIADAKLGTISTAGKVSNSATTATSANTASAIVARDAAGGFSAGYVTADSLHLLSAGLVFPDGTLQTTAAGGPVSVTSAEIVDGTIVDADISASAAIADTKLGTISSSGKVANSATTATSANTASAIVARDAAGGFSAGYVTADSLHLVSAGLVFPDGTLQTTAAGGPVSVTSAEIVDGTIVDADISASAAIADTKLGTISSAGKVANSATTATSANTANAIVARDAAGGFSADYVAVDDSLRVGGEGSFVATGTYDAGTTVPVAVSGAGTRMMWYPEKAAFRAGYVTGAQWDASNIGILSAAFGYNTTASGNASNAFGYNTTASGNYSNALGYGTEASGSYSIAVGNNATASGNTSTALGFQTVASNYYSIAVGAYTAATNTAATALGYGNTASGIGSTGLGYSTIASGGYATALGYSTTASGNVSTALGDGTTAQAYNSLAIGRYNVIQGSAANWVATDPLFVVGNGTATIPSNALTLYKNGNLTIAGTLTQSSDARLKEDIEPLEGTLERVLQLTPIRYRFRAGTGRPGGTQLGLTAQEVQPLFPELVKQDGDGYLSLSYANVSAVLVKAVQEQQAEIRPLQAQIRGLKGEIEELRHARESAEARVARLEALVEQLVAARATSHRDSTEPRTRGEP